MKYSVLSDPLFEVQLSGDEKKKMTLPEIFEALVRNRIVSFEALQVHQKQAWYSFLVQLAAIVATREHQNQLPQSSEEWRNNLFSLSEENQAAWSLVVEDPEQPAFFQSPIPEGTLEEAGYQNDISSPDDLDILITSKNHDVKMNRLANPAVEHWIYSLITLQTLEGFLGRGNYGIARMNGGFGNRPFVGIVPDLSWGSRFLKDVERLIEIRADLTKERYRDQGIALLWMESWDGAKESRIPISSCDPYFIEICRRIRFQESDKGELQCWRTNTKDYRIDGVRDLNGVTADPWTPVDISSDPKALTVSGSGFHYQLLQEIWFGDQYENPESMEFTEHEEEGGYLVTIALVRGQGKTEGYHRRFIPVPQNAARIFQRNKSKREQIGERAEQRVELASDVQKNVLYPALQSLVSAGSEKQSEYEDVEKWIDRFDRSVDDRFFEQLWESIDWSDEKAQKHWEEMLLDLALRELDHAIDSVPIPSVRRLRAITEAESMLWSQARDCIPDGVRQKTIQQESNLQENDL